MSSLKPLPDIEGSKLAPFTEDLLQHDLEFIKLLEVGSDGLCIKAKIDGNLCVIKLFSHQQDPEEGWHLKISEADYPPDVKEHLRLQTRPFYCECRAFGRLKEIGREKIAVKVWGYVAIHFNAEMEKKLQGILDQIEKEAEWRDETDQTNKQYFGLITGNDTPIMAIVKDWVEPEEIVVLHDKKNSGKWWEEYYRKEKRRNRKWFRKMFKDTNSLQKAGIVIQDAHCGQWVRGTLVDLSRAWTVPHLFGPESGLQPSWLFWSIAAWDTSSIAQDISIRNGLRSRSCPDLKPCEPYGMTRFRIESLRNLPHRQKYGPLLPLTCPLGRREENEYLCVPSCDPAQFNWRKFVKKEAAKKSGQAASPTPRPKRASKRKQAPRRKGNRVAKASKSS